MFACRLDNFKFDDRIDAMNHLRDVHPELIEQELDEFTSEAEETAFEEYFEEWNTNPKRKAKILKTKM